MISVPIDRIVPLTDARDNFSRLVSDIESAEEGMYVLTKGGKPTIALVNISYLEELIGRSNGTSESHSTSFAPPKPAFKSNHPAQRAEPKPQEKAPIFNAPAPVEASTPLSRAGTLPATNTPPVSYEPKIAPVVSEPPKEIIEKPKVDPSWTGQDTVRPSFPFPSVPSSAPAAVPPPKAAAAWPLVPPKPAFTPAPSQPPMPPTIANSAPQPFAPPVNAPPVPPLPKPAFTPPPVPPPFDSSASSGINSALGKPPSTVPPALAPNTLSSSPNVTAPTFPKPPEAPALPKPPLGPPPPNPLATPFTTDQPKPAQAVSTDSTITFDSPPKTVVEPGEALPPPPPPPPSLSMNRPPQAPPAPPPVTSTPIQQPVKDLEI